MPRRREPVEVELPDYDPEDEDELEQLWSEHFEDNFGMLDHFDELEDWLENEADWDEDKYGESH